MQKKYKYDELPEGLKKALMRNLTDRYTYEGKENPAEEAEIKLTRIMEPMKKRNWKFYNLELMKKIDKARLNLGMPAYHNV